MKKDFFIVDRQKSNKNMFAVVRLKKLLTTVFIVILAIGSVVGLILLQGCSASKDRILMKSISEYRKNLYVGSTQDILATFTTGKREEPYATDGVSNDMVGYGVLCVRLGLSDRLSEGLHYELYIDTIQYTGELTYNAYDNTYVADINKEINSTDDIYLKLTGDNINTHITLKCISKDWEIDYKTAVRVVAQDMGSELYTYIEGNSISAETFIKIVSEDMEMDKIFWYIHIVCKNGDAFTYLIDVNSGEILAKKGNLIA